jgi:hypothetical protein
MADVTSTRMGYLDRMAAKRRLPLAPSTGDADADPARAPWQWVGFGTVAIFVAWLPLSGAASALAARMVGPTASSRSELTPAAIGIFVGMSALALGLASLIGGLVVGRWGGPGVGIREATLSALVAALVAIAASWASFGVTLSALVVVPFALPFAALGGKLGRSARR